MFEKSKTFEKKITPEKIEKISAEFLSKEIDKLPDSKRSGGFFMTTLLAMGLAIAGAGGAEAQVRTGRIPMAGPTSGLTGEIFQRGRIMASQKLDQKRMGAEIKINQEFQKKIQEIGSLKNQLEKEFRDERITVSEFEMRKQQLDNEVYRLSQEKSIRLVSPLGIKGRVLEGIVRGY